MSKQNNTTRNVVIGVAAAAAVGYIAALLTAPKSGKETRADIVKGAKKAKKTVEKQAKVVEKKAVAEFDNLKKRADNISTAVRELSTEISEIVKR